MGYMKHKYTRAYFPKEDALGNPTRYGAESIEVVKMGYMKHKYTMAYFLKEDALGNPTRYGAEGIEDFKRGSIRGIDKDILQRLDFRGKVVLDLGFGRGEAIKYALERGAARVVGNDFSEAANTIAADFLKDYDTRVELYCDDALQFLESYVASGATERFDIVILFDSVEHIPRLELSKILKLLRSVLSQRGIIAINTPVFRVDNDVIREGLKPKAKDTSDDFEETAGMHCNRYTKSSLKKFMKKCGFRAISGHFFVPVLTITPFLTGSRWAWRKAFSQGYPVQLSARQKPETFEYVSLGKAIRYYRRLRARVLSLLVMAKALVSRIGPLGRFINFVLYRGKGKFQSEEPAENTPSVAQCVQILGGPLKSYHMFLNLGSPAHWQKGMMNGIYEPFIFGELNKIADKITGKVIWDIGAHIGYHTLIFATLVGISGQVVAFEPNEYNAGRLNKNLEVNPDLHKRITIMTFALSNVDADKSFLLHSDVDSGSSTGSHLSDATLPSPASEYKDFTANTIKVVRADTLLRQKLVPIPSLIKIDVEGAEFLVLEGAMELLTTHKPFLLIEIHNITMMFKVQKLLSSLEYDLEILDEENSSVSRCFIIARPKNW